MPLITYREAINQALAEELERDPNVVLMGEEVGQFQGAYKVSEGLLARFGPKRIIDTPISEAGFVGLGVGAAMLGVRPVIELMFWSFYSVAFDQILNNAANVRYMSGGQVNVPIVIRGPANGGTNVGATHSHTPENILANHPGVKVVCPATAYDAKGLLKSAIRDNDPVMFLENTILYNDKSEVPTGEYLIPLGLAEVKRSGTDLTIVAHGRAVITSLKAAQLLESEHDVSVEVVDVRSIRPLDEATILNSVRKTHRVLLVEENKPFCGLDAQLAYMIQAQAFDDLDAPVNRMSALDAPAIYSQLLEKEQLPSPQRIVEVVLKML
jgi:pyruvate dehydrogenase E1 component beta subunit